MQIQKPNMQEDSSKRYAKEFTPVDVEIQFDEEYPLHIKNCKLHITEQPSIVIEYTSPEGSQTIKSKLVRLEVPFSAILCIGKKSSSTTLLMLKDQEKVIERDENGYELVSDDEQDEEFQQKENPLYSQIKKSVQYPQTQPKTINISQKCNLLLTIDQSQQISTQPQTESNTLSQQLYKYLSERMELYQQIFTQTSKNQWTTNLTNFQELQFDDAQIELEDRDFDGQDDMQNGNYEDDGSEDFDEEQINQIDEENQSKQ